jgi:hypothetical protein
MARRFLLHTSSGPLLQPRFCYRDITLACIITLIVGLENLDKMHEASMTLDIAVRVGKGLYGLSIYAHEFWIEHLLSLTTIEAGAIRQEGSALSTLLQQLLVTSTTQSRNDFVGEDEALEPDEALKNLADQPEVQAFVRRELTARSNFKSMGNAGNS